MATTKTIRQNVTFDATPAEVYDALIDPKIQRDFTGAKTTMRDRVGGAFTAYDGYISGKNITLEPGEKIVQEWHASDWPDECISRVTFILRALPNGKTRLHMLHENIPLEFAKDIADGWQKFYWEPMREMFAGRP